MQPARKLVPAAAEFASCMQYCKNNRNSRDAHLVVDANRYAAPVVCYAYHIFRKYAHIYLVAVPGKRFVNGIVYNFIYKMVKPVRTR